MTEEKGKKIVIVNPKEPKDRSWLYNVFLRRRDFTKVNMMIENVSDEEMKDLESRGVVIVPVGDGDIIYPEVVETEVDMEEIDKLRGYIKFLDTFLKANLTESKLMKIWDKSTRVDGEVMKNGETIGWIEYDMDLMSPEDKESYEAYIEAQKEEASGE